MWRPDCINHDNCKIRWVQTRYPRLKWSFFQNRYKTLLSVNYGSRAFQNVRDEVLTLPELGIRSINVTGPKNRQKVIPPGWDLELQNRNLGFLAHVRLGEAISPSSRRVRSSCLAFWKALDVYFHVNTKSNETVHTRKFIRAKRAKIPDFS